VGGARVVYRSNLYNSKIDDFEQFKDGPKIVMIVIFLTVMRSGIVHQSKIASAFAVILRSYLFKGKTTDGVALA